MAYNLTSADLPVPIGPSVAYLRSSCTDSSTSDPVDNAFSTGDFAANITEKLNWMLSVLTVVGSYPAGMFGVASGLKLYTAYDAGVTYEVGDYASDSGVVYQCILQSVGHTPPNVTYWAATDLLPVTDLNIGIVDGVAVAYSSLEFTNDLLTLPDATATVFVWLKLGEWNPLTKSAGTLDFTTTITPPALNSVLLGYCATAAGVITPGTINYLGRMTPNGNLWERTTADIGAPVDTPSPDTFFLTHTQAGTYLWVNGTYQSVGTSSTTATTGTTITLTTADPSTQAISLTADTDITLPATPTAFGMIANTTTIALGYVLTVKDSTGSYTYATINPGEFINVSLIVDPMTGALSYQPVYIPTNGVTANYVLDTQTGSVTGGFLLTINISSNGGPVIIMVAEDTAIGLMPISVTCGGVPMTAGPGSAGGVTFLFSYYLLNPPVGVIPVVFNLGSGSNNFAGIVRSLNATATTTLGDSDNHQGTGTTNSLVLDSGVGSIVLDMIAVATGHTATTNKTPDGSPVSVGALVMYSAEAYGSGGTTSMDYTIAASGTYNHLAVVFEA